MQQLFQKIFLFEKLKKVYERGMQELSFNLKFVNVRQKLFEIFLGNRLYIT